MNSSPFLYGSCMEAVGGGRDAQCWGLSWGRDFSFPLMSFLGWVVQGLRGHVNHEVHHPVAVARFVVIPGLSLIKVFIEGNVKVGSVGVTVKIIGDNPVLSIA